MLDSFLQDCPLEQDPAIAAEAAKADIGAKPCDLPITPATWMSFAQANDIAKVDFEGRVSHPRPALAHADAG